MRVRELKVVYGEPCGSYDGRQLLTPAVSVNILRPILDPEPSEIVGVLLLNAKHRVLGWHVLSRGGTDYAQVDPRSLVRAALLTNATAVVLAHNHPSGDPEPSPEDATLTERLRMACGLMKISLLDHVIIGSGSGQHFSFKQAGRL